MMIVKIAKAELRSIFFSPVAWFVSIVFLFMWGSAYASAIYNWANFQEVAFKYSPNFKDFGSMEGITFTKLILGAPSDGSSGILGIAIKYLFLFVPLLTMGLISRELNSGTDKLLYSSPVRLRQIVLGKYLGMMIYNIFLLMIAGVFFVTLALSVKSPDLGLMVSVATGIFLLMCTYSAIGMFMSSLTSYQVLSGIAAFVVLGILNHIGNLWQRVDIVRDLTWFLSLPGRAEKMLLGLMTTKDLIYFMVITSLFICFTIFRLRGQRETKPWYIKAGRYSLTLIVALFIGYFSSSPTLTGYWDATATNTNTIPENIQQLVRKLDKGPLEVTLYTNLVGQSVEYGLPENRNKFLSELWDPYLRFKPDIHFKFVYYYDYTDDGVIKKLPENDFLKKAAVAKAKAIGMDFSLFKSPEEIRKIVDLKDEGHRPVMLLKYGKETVFLRTFQAEPPPDKREQIMGAALKRLLQPAPRVYFIADHYERSIFKIGERELANHTLYAERFNALGNHGFEFDTLALETNDIPANATALVLADPKVNLSTGALDKLQRYISKGGNMLIMGEPGKQFILNPVLQQLGVQLLNGQLAQPSKDETPDKVIPLALGSITGMSETIKDEYNKQLSYGEPFPLIMPGVTALSAVAENSFTVKPLFATVEKAAWLKTGKLVIDSAEVFFNPEEGDIAASLPVAMGLTRQVNGKEQRILVAGDADFMSNMRVEHLKNLYFVNSIYSWMSYGEFPVYAPRPKSKDLLLLISRNTAKIHKIIFVWILPEILLVLAIIFLIRRKRK